MLYFSISHPGNPPTDLTLSRVGLERVRVTWTDPDIRPHGGYRIEVVSVNINMTSDMSPREITLTPRSTPYEVTLVSLSRHYPINNIMESITLNGETLSNQLIHCYCCCCCTDLLAPTSPSVSSLTATSVTISWTQPVDSMTVNIYRVTLTTTSAGMCSGVNHTREENTTSTSIVIDGLEENSIYTVTISAVNNEFNAVSSTSGLTVTAGMFTSIIRIWIASYMSLHHCRTTPTLRIHYAYRLFIVIYLSCILIYLCNFES